VQSNQGLGAGVLSGAGGLGSWLSSVDTRSQDANRVVSVMAAGVGRDDCSARSKPCGLQHSTSAEQLPTSSANVVTVSSPGVIHAAEVGLTS